MNWLFIFLSFVIAVLTSSLLQRSIAARSTENLSSPKYRKEARVFLMKFLANNSGRYESKKVVRKGQNNTELLRRSVAELERRPTGRHGRLFGRRSSGVAIGKMRPALSERRPMGRHRRFGCIRVVKEEDRAAERLFSSLVDDGRRRK